MAKIRGALFTNQPDVTYRGHRVVFEFSERVTVPAPDTSNDAGRGSVTKPGMRSAAVRDDGGFEVDLPDVDKSAPVVFTVHSPGGEILHQENFPADDVPSQLRREVAPKGALLVEPHPDQFRGRRAKLTGRVFDEDGCTIPAGLQVVLRARSVDSNALEVVLVSCTDRSGYFSGDYPRGEYVEAVGEVSAVRDHPAVIPLRDGAFPDQVVIVVPLSGVEDHGDGDAHEHRPGGDGHSTGKGCCADTTPAVPDPIDLANSPTAYSSDLGTGRCVDFTMPNRTLEEFNYYRVERTTDPEIKGLTVSEPRKLPSVVLNHLVSTSVKATVAKVEAVTQPVALTPDPGGSTEAGAAAVAASKMLRIAGLSTLKGTSAVRELDDGVRQLKRAGVRVKPEVLRAIASDPDSFTPGQLMTAERHSAFEFLHEIVGVLGKRVPGRAPLGVDNPVDWDDTPTFYQATTIAHGHLLHFKQVWRADGYSLGDLLYSLPLAPCQKKQIAIVEWDRRESALRAEVETEEERMAAVLSRDRDIAEIVSTSAHESLRGGSEASTKSWAAGGGLGFGFAGFFIGGGGGGGGSKASSRAWQDSARTTSGNSLQQLRDNVMQAASAVRSRRATVVQAARQGEAMRVQTEVVANHNHCHAMTIEYFEVLRHFLVSQELADVQECLFVPLLMSRFDGPKALRWRESLGRFLRDRSLAPGFAALERIEQNYLGSDFPTGTYAEEHLSYLDGELRVALNIARPRDPEADENFFSYINQTWGFWQVLLGGNAHDVYNAYLRNQSAKERVWREQLAPRLASAFVAALKVWLVDDAGVEHPLDLDPTLVSDYREGAPLYVTLSNTGAVPGLRRDRVRGVRIRTFHELPAGSKVIVHSAYVRYRTPHMSHPLVRNVRVMNDLTVSDDVFLSSPLDRVELRNPRQEDKEISARLLRHLNAHLEYYHRAIWWAMDPDRRFMLLDGYIAPNSGGRSVASVVENRLVGIMGNCLVLPVARGFNLDPTYRRDEEDRADLLDVYAPLTPIPPFRISVPTRGVFAEAVLGSCNSCEEKDERRFWRWEESPCPDEPTAIVPVSTESRRAEPPDVRAQGFPSPIVAMQNVPAAPDPTGLTAAFQVLANPNLFRDVAGLTETQRNALEGLRSAFNLAGSLGGQAVTQAANLALQRTLGRDIDKAMQKIQDARTSGLLTDAQARGLTETAIRGMLGGGATTETQARPLSEQPAVEDAIRRGSGAPGAEVSVSRGAESVSVRNALAGGDGRAGGIILASSRTGTAPIPTLRVRLPHTSTQIDWPAYIAAIDGLRNTPDPANPAQSVYESFVQIHVQAFSPVGASWRVHTFDMVAGDNFLAWHRAFLLKFEEAAQVTLPYWDWRLGAAIPPPLEVANLPAAWGVARNPGMPGTRFPDRAEIDALVNNTRLDFIDFQSRLETRLHNPVHVWVGGVGPGAGHMSMAVSPRDPLFWLLHAMVDRLWEEWQLGTNFAKPPTNTSEQLQPRPPMTHSVGALLDTVDLGYRYDGLPFRLPAMVLPSEVPTIVA